MKKSTIIIIITSILLISIFSVLKFTGNVSITSINSCIDSDLGQEYWTKGNIRGESYNHIKQTQEQFSEEDFCKDGKTLIEHYCITDNSKINSYKKSEEYNCPEGCKNGKCLGQKIENPKPDLITKLKKLFGI